jgi:hypothetical protein
MADSTPSHLLTVWNPAYAEDALDAHLRVLIHLLERDDVVGRALGAAFSHADAGWLRGPAPAELRGIADLRNPAAHFAVVDRDRCAAARERVLGIGCEGLLVRIARAKGGGSG